MFDKLVQVLVLGATYDKIADSTCSATTIRNRDEWIEAEIFETFEQICLDAYDHHRRRDRQHEHRVVGLDLTDVTVDGCIVKAPCGGETACRKFPVDRGTKRSLLSDGAAIPGCLIAPANVMTPRSCGRRSRGWTGSRSASGSAPDQITVHLDAGYDCAVTRDLLDKLGCHGVISQKGFPLKRAEGGSWSAPTPAQPNWLHDGRAGGR